MIEIVYKENKEQANGNEGYFHLPKNIRQVGDTNGRERIYLEDYVGTFLKKYFSAPEGRAAMLFGEFKWADGISYFFIRSAAAIHTMEPAPDHLVFDDAVWTEVHDVMEKYFKNQQILGWALSLPGYGEDLNEQIIRAHLNHFGGNDKTLFRVNGQEKEETFYTYEGGTLRSTGGFYIYYEKNEPMQSYLIDQNQNRSIENGESVPDRAVSDFRKMIEEKSGEEPEHDHRKPILYAMTACAAAALLVTVTQKYGDALPFPGKTRNFLLFFPQLFAGEFLKAPTCHDIITINYARWGRLCSLQIVSNSAGSSGVMRKVCCYYVHGYGCQARLQ